MLFCFSFCSPYACVMVAQFDPHKLLEDIGCYGMFQVFSYCLVQTLNAPYAAAMFVMTFMEMDPTTKCVTKTGFVKPGDECTVYLQGHDSKTCDASENAILYIVNSNPVDSVHESFNLLCSNGFVKELGFCMFTIGAVLVVPLISVAADHYGRKTVLLLCLSVSSMANFLIYLVPNAFSFFLLRFVVGAASDGYLTIVGILSCELVAQGMRDWFGLIYNVAWSGGLLYTGLLSLVFSDWRPFYLSASIISLFLLPIYAIWVPETPHWLCEHGKHHLLQDYVTLSNAFNGQNIKLADCEKSQKEEADTRSTLAKMGEALKDNKFRCQMIVNGYIQFVIALFYCTVTLESTKMTSDTFLGFALSAGIELPGGIITVPALKWFGRKTLVWLSLFLQGALIATFPFMPITVNLISKVANGVVYSAHPLLLTEMIPTSMRTSMYSLVNIPQSLGIILAPYLKYMQFGTTYVMYLILASTSILAALLTFVLPETKGRKLPGQFKEIAKSRSECGSEACDNE